MALPLWHLILVFLAPSLALNAVVDFPIWISVIAVGGSAALYTSIVSRDFVLF